MGQEWHYTQNGEKHGPVSGAEIKRLAASGKLQPTDLVWKQGMENWTPASRIKGLFAATTPAEPPPLPMTVVKGNERPAEADIAPKANDEAFSDWYAKRFGSLNIYIQGALWLCVGYFWIPLLYLFTQLHRVVSRDAWKPSEIWFVVKQTGKVLGMVFTVGFVAILAFFFWPVFLLIGTPAFLYAWLSACPSCKKWWAGVNDGSVDVDQTHYKTFYHCKFCNARWSTVSERIEYQAAPQMAQYGSEPEAAHPAALSVPSYNPYAGTPSTRQEIASKPRTTAVALVGAVIVGQDSSTVEFRKKCERCGHVEPGVTRMQIPSGTCSAVFMCSNCRNNQEYRIQGG